MTAILDFTPRVCSCSQVTISEKERTIICQQCGKSIDPFRYILTMRARLPSSEMAVSEQAFAKLQDDIANMRRERENLRIQINAMRRKRGV